MYKDGGRYPVVTPALEGSKSVSIPTELPRGAYGGRYGRGPYLPPLGGRPSMFYLPSPSYPMSSMARAPVRQYRGPPQLLPYWGGYSVGPNYFPERQPIPGPPSMPPPPVSKLGPPLEVEQNYPRKSVKPKKTLAFPGPKALRRFRHIGYMAWFIARLKANARKNLECRPSSMFLFGIILKEIVAALHRIYLNPNGCIYPVLHDCICSNAYDLSSLVRGGDLGTREEGVLLQELQYMLENIIYHCTEIMPSKGVLGTHRKSAVFELIRSGKRFPDGYFWQVELERIHFSQQGRTVNVGDSEGFLLLLGIFISRSLVTTILMKPVDYGLSSDALTDVAERNLRVLASTLLFLVRRIAVSRSRGMMGMPQEIERYLYSDEEMANVYSKLSRSFNYCEGLLREWGTEYLRRLRASSMH